MCQTLHLAQLNFILFPLFPSSRSHSSSCLIGWGLLCIDKRSHVCVIRKFHDALLPLLCDRQISTRSSPQIIPLMTAFQIHFQHFLLSSPILRCLTYLTGMAEVLPEGKMMQVCRSCQTQPVLQKQLCPLRDIAKESQSCEALTFHNNAKPRKYNTLGNFGWEVIFFNICWSTCSNSGSAESPMSSRTLSHERSPVWKNRGHEAMLLLLIREKLSPRRGGVQRQGPGDYFREEMGRCQESQICCHAALAWVSGLCIACDKGQTTLVFYKDDVKVVYINAAMQEEN